MSQIYDPDAFLTETDVLKLNFQTHLFGHFSV